MGSWLEPMSLSAEQSAMIRAELSARRDPVFHDPERQTAFLARIERALTVLQNHEPSNVFAVRDGIEAVQASAIRLQGALNRLNMEASDALSAALDPRLALSRLSRDLARLAEAAGNAARSARKPRGRYDGNVQFLIWQMAEGWHSAFDRSASASPDGAFVAVANLVLGQTGFPEAGKDAFRAALNQSE
jgi:hypothetical protein